MTPAGRARDGEGQAFRAVHVDKRAVDPEHDLLHRGSGQRFDRHQRRVRDGLDMNGDLGAIAAAIAVTDHVLERLRAGPVFVGDIDDLIANDLCRAVQRVLDADDRQKIAVGVGVVAHGVDRHGDVFKSGGRVIDRIGCRRSDHGVLGASGSVDAGQANPEFDIGNGVQRQRASVVRGQGERGGRDQVLTGARCSELDPDIVFVAAVAVHVDAAAQD